MFKSRMAIILLIMVFSGCETLFPNIEEINRLESQKYVGQNIDAVVEEFGYADSMSESPDGNRVFVYSSFHVSNSSVDCYEDSNGNHSCSGGSITEKWCKKYFEVDASNIIVNVFNKGNDCAPCRDRFLCFR